MDLNANYKHLFFNLLTVNKFGIPQSKPIHQFIRHVPVS